MKEYKLLIKEDEDIKKLHESKIRTLLSIKVMDQEGKKQPRVESNIDIIIYSKFLLYINEKLRYKFIIDIGKFMNFNLAYKFEITSIDSKIDFNTSITEFLEMKLDQLTTEFNQLEWRKE